MFEVNSLSKCNKIRRLMDDELSKQNCKQLIVVRLDHFDMLSNEVNRLNHLDFCTIYVLLG
jgi:hypothetical protein